MIHKTTHITYTTHIITQLILFTRYLHNSCFKVYFLKLIRKIFFINFFVYMKMTNDYHQKRNKRPQKEARERHQNLSEEEKD